MEPVVARRRSADPTFSVVICTHNRAELLPRSIDSVLDQRWSDFELVVLDDGSTDDTAAVVQQYTDARVHYVYQENQGLGAARNAGVAHSSGRYVVFLDDDDFAMPVWLERFAAALHGDPAYVSCGELLADDSGTVLQTRLPVPLGPGFADYDGWFLPGTFVVRRDAYDAVGGFLPGIDARGAHRIRASAAARVPGAGLGGAVHPGSAGDPPRGRRAPSEPRDHREVGAKHGIRPRAAR